MKIKLIVTLILIANISFAQSWTPINGKQRFNLGLGLPVKDSSYYVGDTSLIYIGLDSNLYYKRRSYNNLIITKNYSNSRYLDSVSKVSNFRYRFYKNGLTFYDQIFDTSSSGIATNYSTYKVDTVSNITSLQSYSGVARNIFVSDTLRGGYFNLVYNTTVYNDGGIYFAATGVGSNYHWRRNTTQNNYLSIDWWGAIPDYNFSTKTGTDNTTAIQAALNYAATLNSRKPVFVPSGAYMTGKIMIPDAVKLYGTGSVMSYPTNSALIAKANLNTHLIVFGYHSYGGRKYCEGGIRDIALWGDWRYSTSGFGISFRDTLNNRVCPQDAFYLENICITGFPSGGIEFADANESSKILTNVRLVDNRGYGIDFINPGVGSAQLTTFTEISTTNNSLGAIHLSGTSQYEAFNIVNLKSEEGVNQRYTTDTLAEAIGIVIENCNETPIIISGMEHACTITKSNGYTRKVGNAIQIKGNKYPKLSWSGCLVRMVTSTNDPADPDPYMVYVENTSDSINWRVNAASLGIQNYSTDTIVTVGVAGAKSRFIVGGGYSWTYPTPANEQGIKVVNTLPYIGISESDQPAGLSDFGLRSYSGDGALVSISADSKFQQFFRMKKQSSGLPYSSAITRTIQLTDSSASSSSIPALDQNSSTPVINSSSFFATQNTVATSINSFGTGAAGMLLYVQTNDNLTTFVNKASSSADNLDMGGYNLTGDSGEIYLFIRNQNYWKYIGNSNILNRVNTFTKQQNFSAGLASYGGNSVFGSSSFVSGSNAKLQISGAITGANTTINGVHLFSYSNTYTDNSTAASGTATWAVANSMHGAIFAATNTGVTYNQAATLYIAAAPTAGTNATITNPYALYVSNGLSRFPTLLTSNNAYFGSKDLGVSNGKVIIYGAVTGANTTTYGVQLSSYSNTYTDNTTAASGTASFAVANSFNGAGFAATNTGVTYTNAATVYIAAAPAASTNATITNSWALYTAAGNTRLAGLSVNIGSDATGDLLYRSSTGLLSRLGVGSTGSFLTVSGGLPAWSSSTITLGGNFTTSGAFTTTLTSTANTSVTLPSSGYIVAANTPSALTAGATITLTPSQVANSFTLNVGANATSTLNMGTIPTSMVGSDIDLSITSTTTSCVITFGTSFKSQGVLTTGVVSGKIFHMKFHVVSTSQVDEVSRTIAM